MLSFLEGGGQTAADILRHDWSTSPLGPPGHWPSVLKTSLGIVLGSRFPQCIVWGPGLITIPNDAFLPILGDKPPALGRPFSDVWREVWPSLAPIVERCFAGEATYIEDFALALARRGQPEQAYFTFCYSPIRDEQGHVVGMLDTVTETTEKVRLHAQQALLSRELGHRLKNLLSVVQAVAGQTLRQSSDLRSANEALSFRLAALGRAADVLTASEWDDAELHDLLRAAISAHDVSGRIRIDGPPVRFRSEVALALTLALHELITNAIKYGALSNHDGRVDITWSILPGPNDGEPRFMFDWREIGGPPVSPPTRKGFGSLMIEKSLRGYFRGDTVIAYDPAGLTYHVDAPLRGVEAKDVID